MKMKSDCLSPCVRHCCLNEEDICLGCFRTLDEILTWHQASNEQKTLIVEKAELRKAAYKAMRFSR